MTKLYNLYRIRKGKHDLMMTDSFANVKKRKDQLASSYQRQGVILKVEEASEEDSHYKRPSHNRWKNYDKPKYPRRVK